MRQDQISLQLYTVHEETARDMPGTLRRISEIGHPAVEFAGFGGLSAEDLRNILADLGLRASGAHVPFDSWEKDPEAVLNDMHALSCNHAIVPIASPEYRRDEAELAKLAGSLNRWGELCRQEDVTFSYHNHDFEFAPLGGPTWAVLLCGTSWSERRTLSLSISSWISTGSATVARTRSRCSQTSETAYRSST